MIFENIKKTINRIKNDTDTRYDDVIIECPVCDKPFIKNTCIECDKLVANLK